MQLKNKITSPYQYVFNVTKAGLVAIFVSVRCKSKKQINSNTDEDLRVEISGLRFREIPPEKNIQLYNIPPSFNGSRLKGLKKTVIFLTVLGRGENTLRLIPRNNAFVDAIFVKELSGKQKATLELENSAEDGNRRPWITFVLVDLPLRVLTASITTRWRLKDSDDVKLIVDNNVYKNTYSFFWSRWLWSGSVLKKLFKKETQVRSVELKLSQGIHYIEFWADRMPILHKINFDLSYIETKSEERASGLIQDHASIIRYTANEYGVDPVIVGAVIYQEQATNVNFIDALTDYIGGLLHLNTSIGIGQIRIKTAKHLEKFYPGLDPYKNENSILDYNMVRVERLKDPFTNIKYVASKIHFTRERWKKAGFDISERPEILGTLYNIEDVADPIKPHLNPESNKFGYGVGMNYKKVKKLLGL
jgi:hypothetical protein